MKPLKTTNIQLDFYFLGFITRNQEPHNVYIFPRGKNVIVLDICLQIFVIHLPEVLSDSKALR